MNIAIGICEKVNGICTTMGCFRAFNNKDKHFKAYEGQDIILSSFFTCQICSSGSQEWLEELASRLSEKGVSILHLGICVVKCKANKKEEIINIFKAKNIKVVEGTH